MADGKVDSSRSGAALIIQHFAKTLLRPLNPALSSKDAGEPDDEDEGDCPSLITDDESDDEDGDANG